jgi:TRAP-type C4-dicarboxylate transport system permease small subunit
MAASRLARALSAPIHALDRIMAVLLGGLVGILALGVIVTVFLRYVFGISYAWAEELLTMIFIATTFFGAALGVREGEHIALSILPGKHGSPLRKTIAIAVMLVVIAVSAVLFVYSGIWIERVGAVPSPATGIPNGAFYLIVPISSAITIFYALARILGQFVGIEEARTKSDFGSDSSAEAAEGRAE